MEDINLYNDAPLNKSPKKNWVEKRGGLPGSVRARARALKRKHPEWTLSHAIAVAINAVKYSVKADDTKLPGKQNQRGSVKARHARDYAKWEKMKNHTEDDMGGLDILLADTSAGKKKKDKDKDTETGSGDTNTKLDENSRKKYASEGNALEDGSFPINNEQDLKNAVKALGRADPAKRDKVKAHIRKRARELGVSVNLANTDDDKKKKKVVPDDQTTDKNADKTTGKKMGAKSSGVTDEAKLAKVIAAYKRKKKNMSPAERKKVEARIKSSKQQLGKKGVLK